MTRNQLPEGVGKKIVEALKRQAEADITPIPASKSSLTNNIPLDINDMPESKFDSLKESVETNDNTIVEEESTNSFSSEVYKDKEEIQQQKESIFNINDNQNNSYVNPVLQMNEDIQVKTPAIANAKINIPSNVAILKNLISSLPVGVTKQTGAQIIRQTLEAMGLPMASVLKEAQEVQEELNSSTKECMLRIQEFKTNIMQLEQSVQEYQRNMNQINDLVSLFLLTDRK